MDIQSTSPLPLAPVSSWANGPPRMWHVSPGQFFGSSAVGKTSAEFLSLHANIGQRSDNLPALRSFFFHRSTLDSEGYVIERRKRKTNNHVRPGDTGPSIHTYLFLICSLPHDFHLPS